MKHYLQNSLRALFLSMVMLLPLPMLGENIQMLIGGINYEIDTETKEATVVQPELGSYSGSIAIPGTVEFKGITHNVTGIGNYAFSSCEKLTSITIPNSVTDIGNKAFFDCDGLSTVTIPNSVTDIGEKAFSDCYKLTTIKIGNGVKKIGKNAFNNCSNLTYVYISDIVTWCHIDFENSSSNPLHTTHRLYLNGKEIKSLIIPNNVKSIGKYAFSFCTNLTSVTIGNGVTNIGQHAFDACWDLSFVTISDAETTIENSAFAGCSKLSYLNLGNNLVSIGDYAFTNCSALTLLNIPNSTTSIGNQAFYYCKGLKSITLGSGITDIGSEAFAYLQDLTDIYCHAEDVPSTNSKAFEKSYIGYVNLHVPATSIESYKATEPWSKFGNIQAIAKEAEKYIITYELDGVEFKKDTLEVGAIITPPQAPEKEGHTFAGWENVPETMPANDIVIVGSYSVNKYLLTFKIGDEVIASDSIKYGAKVETPQVAEKEGHTFNGWENVPETMPANDVVVVGSYSVNKYLLTFKIGDEVIASDSVEYGTKVETPQVAEKEGHTFNGWENVPETMPANDIVVVGSYTVNIYKVYYYVGDELVHTEEVAYGDNIPSYEYTPTNGDKFMGWEGEQYDTMPAHDVTYIANIESSILYINGDMSNYQIYDLNGRKIENVKNLKSGVYIVNGKKTIIKVN